MELKRIVKSIFVFGVLFLTSAQLYGQDVITFTNGKKEEVKIDEVLYTEIKYRRFSNLSGPVYTVPVYLIHTIQYEDGLVEEYRPLKVKESVVKAIDKEKGPEVAFQMKRHRFFLEGVIGVTGFSRILAEGAVVHGDIFSGGSSVQKAGRYSEMIPTVGLRFGSKFYLGDMDKKFLHGVQMNWLTGHVHLQRRAGIHVGLIHPGYVGVLKFNDKTGVEFGLNGGVTVLARDLDFDSFGYFPLFTFKPILGYLVTPGVRFNLDGFCVGLEYSYGAMFGADNDPVYHTVNFTIGRTF